MLIHLAAFYKDICFRQHVVKQVSYFYNMLQVTCAIIREGTEILVARMGENSAHPFQWEFPGGKIKDAESDEECIKREIREELEVNIEIEQPLEPVIFDYGFRKIELKPFLCRITSGRIKLNEHINVKWVSWKVLQTLDLAGADKKLIQQNFNRKILEKQVGEQKYNSR